MDKKSNSLSGNDLREGLTAVISVKLPNPQFEGQTKTKLGNSEIKGLVDSMVDESLSDYVESNPKVGKVIVQKVAAQRVREAARAQDLARRKTSLESTTLPGKLADCTEKDPTKCEVFLAEGDSAEDLPNKEEIECFKLFCHLEVKYSMLKKHAWTKF